MSGPRWSDEPDPHIARIAKMFEHWDERNDDLQRLLDMPHSALAERALELEQAERINLANIARLREERDDLAKTNLRLRAREYELEEALERPCWTLRGYLRRIDWRTVALVVTLALLWYGWSAAVVEAIP